MEYFVTMTTHVREETPGQTVAGIRAHRAAHSSGLAGQGHLWLWRPPGWPYKTAPLTLCQIDHPGLAAS